MNPSVTYSRIIALLWLASVVLLCHVPHQHEFNKIILFGGLAFGCYVALLWSPAGSSLGWMIGVAIIARIGATLSFPHLSDDIYRFIWDGRLWHLGINPFSHLPSHWNSEGLMDQALFDLLNSPNYYTIYPPLPQLIFYLSSWVETADYRLEAFIMKGFHLMADLGVLRILWLLLKEYNLPPSRWLLYALNPLIILEVIGNVHHEGLMLLFLLLSLWYLHKGRATQAGIMMALSIACKILPLLLCPLIFFRLPLKARFRFTIATAMVVMVLFGSILLPDNFGSNLLRSADLYVRSFEFNASIYYILKCIGYWIYGYNMIAVIGPLMKILSAVLIMCLAFKYRKSTVDVTMPLLMILTFGVYLLLSSTIHPWYIILLIGLAPLTDIRFPIIWSGLIMGTYINYSYDPYQESIWMVIIEYLIVGAIALIEYRRFNNKIGLLPIFGK